MSTQASQIEQKMFKNAIRLVQSSLRDIVSDIESGFSIYSLERDYAELITKASSFSIVFEFKPYVNRFTAVFEYVNSLSMRSSVVRDRDIELVNKLTECIISYLNEEISTLDEAA